MGLLDRKQPGGRGRITVPDRKALVAAAKRRLTAAATPADRENQKNLRTLHQPWQAKAFGWYDKLGECWNPAQFYARSLSKITIYAAERDENGKIVPSDDPALKAIVESIRDRQGRQSTLLSSFGRLDFLIGDQRLVQYRDEDDDDPVWEFLSPTELALADEGRTILRVDIPGGDKIRYENISDVDGAGDPEVGQMRMWRFHRPHPQHSGLADSPVKGVLDLYEQLWWLTMSERADLHNRIANAGMLLIPEEIDFEEDDDEEIEGDGAATDEDPEVDPFTGKLTEAMSTAIGDPGDATAGVPVVVRGPGDELHPDRFRHIRFFDPQTSIFVSNREEALTRRISVGLDLPVEEVMGLSMANHWTAWKIDEEKWAHVEPVITRLCEDLGALLLQPISGNPNALIWYDNSALVTDPDKGKTAIQLHKDGVLKAEATLEANGFTEDELMDGDERQEWLAIQLRDSTLIGGEGPEEPVADTQEPPAEEDAPADDDELAVRMIEHLFRQARAAEGARVRGFKRSCPECFEGLDAVPNAAIVAVLGKDKLRRMNADGSFMRIYSRFVDGACELGLLDETHSALIPDFIEQTMWETEPDLTPLIAAVLNGRRER